MVIIQLKHVKIVLLLVQLVLLLQILLVYLVYLVDSLIKESVHPLVQMTPILIQLHLNVKNV
jgi:hypothetical protein